jgi:hypothetical protein
MLREDLLHDLELFLAAGIIQAQQQNTGMELTGSDDEFTEVLVHRDHQPLLLRSKAQDRNIRHGWVKVTYGNDVHTLACQPALDGPADTDVHQKLHAAANM